MIETKLSNLTLLQIMGGVDPFADNFSDYSQNDLDRIVDFKMNETTTPHLYESILEKSISAQLGNGDGYLREITQNGIDSYNPYSHKKIEFTTEEDEHGGLLLTVKDYGCGMSTRDVIKNLLIPYNSGSNGDLSKTGEHGLGFFSCFDEAYWVHVKTGNGKKTEAVIYRENGEWKTQIENYDESFQGTEIKMYLSPDDELPGLPNLTFAERNSYLKKALQKYVGLVNDADVDISFNNEPINTLRKDYRAMANTRICNKSLDDQMVLYVKHEPSSIKHAFTCTQKGLLISEGYYYRGNCLNKRLADLITESGFVLWFDVPRNIGLTKGRNGIVAEDEHIFNNAFTSLFEEAVLRMFLSESYTQKFDSRLTDLIDELLEGTYKENIEDKVERFGANYFQKNTNISTEKINEEQKQFFSELGGFAKKLMHNKMIFGILKEGSDEMPQNFSLMDIAAAYMKDEAFDIESDKVNNGLYVKLDNYSVQAVLRFIDKKKNSWGILSNASMDKDIFINHTPVELFEKIKLDTGFGEEYTKFLEVVNYLDRLVSESTGLGYSKVMLHKDISNKQIAHTDYKSISFNLNNELTNHWMDKISEGKIKDETLDGLLEVILHEKSHVERGVFDGKSLHNTTFYKTKRNMRMDFIIYCHQQKIDPMVEINKILNKNKITKRTHIDDLKETIDAYSDFFEQK